MLLTSSEFQNNSAVPPRFTCNGADINPALQIFGVPPETRSLVLIVDDPDAPAGVWDHWIVFDIDPSVKTVAENSVPGKEGRNSFNRRTWGGPCPPSGTHRYFFKLYALDKPSLGLGAGASREQVERAMAGHILDKAELVGLYRKF
ncbi:MAG: YbhB/YbcL family Raf kinase inhibitor-like protein [Candidatus Omnitrophica bacterium]|nr:YbhB/YbcL family Raf kinase inhibitor-like protein [Candidatus Omnitrophota bacterium]